jgi:hypothetical protein
VVVALSAGIASACVSPDEVYMPEVSSSSGSGGATSGTGGGAPSGQSRTETVNGGTIAKNAQYRMVFTLGQPALSQQKGSAPGLRLQGGLIGATETTP